MQFADQIGFQKQRTQFARRFPPLDALDLLRDALLLRAAFLSGAVLELAATLGIALVAVVVGVSLAEGNVGFEAALLFDGVAPALGDTVYLAVASVAALALGAFVFTRVDDRVAVEV